MIIINFVSVFNVSSFYGNEIFMSIILEMHAANFMELKAYTFELPAGTIYEIILIA